MVDWRKLEKASGLTRRSLERYRGQGLPLPKRGQTPKAWVDQVLTPWRKANRQKTGPKAIPGDAPAAGVEKNARLHTLQEDILQLRKDDLQHELRRKRSEFVLRVDHEAVLIALIDAVRDLLQGRGERLRARLARREEEDVQRELDDDSGTMLEELASGRWRPERNEEAVDRTGQ